MASCFDTISENPVKTVLSLSGSLTTFVALAVKYNLPSLIGGFATFGLAVGSCTIGPVAAYGILRGAEYLLCECSCEDDPSSQSFNRRSIMYGSNV